MANFNEVFTQVAISRIGIKESGGNNRGPEIDRYARQVGLDPTKKGYSWCTSGLFDAAKETAEKVGVPNPFPRTAKAVRVFELLMAVCYEPNPGIGYVYVLAHGDAWKSLHYTDDGHIGACVFLDTNAVPDEVSGNTFADKGSREGNCWAKHTGYPEVTHGGVLLGWLNLEKAIKNV